jgi:hypothetical protein
MRRRKPHHQLARRGIVLLGLLAGAAGLLAGCGLFEDEPPPCPRVAILDQAKMLTLYQEGAGRDLTDVTFEAGLADVSNVCEYDFDEDEGNQVTVQFILLVIATRGPAATTETVEVPYFVAIADPMRRVLAKRVFTAVLDFPDNNVRAQKVEEIEQIIPIAPQFAGPDYLVFVGLQFTREQLEELREKSGR